MTTKKQIKQSIWAELYEYLKKDLHGGGSADYLHRDKDGSLLKEGGGEIKRRRKAAEEILAFLAERAHLPKETTSDEASGS